MDTIIALYCDIFFVLSIRKRTKQQLDYESFDKWFHISTYALPALIFPRCFVNDPILSTVLACFVSFIEGFQYLLYVTTKPKGKVALTLRSEIIHILRPLGALKWITSPTQSRTFLAYCLFSTIDAVIEILSLCIPMTVDTIFLGILIFFSSFCFGLFGCINACIASTAMIYRSQNSVFLVSLAIIWAILVLYASISQYEDDVFRMTHSTFDLYSPRFDAVDHEGAINQADHLWVSDNSEAVNNDLTISGEIPKLGKCGWKTHDEPYPFPWKQKKALINQNSEVFVPVLQRRGFQITRDQYDVKDTTFVWGKNKRIWRSQDFVDVEGSFRLGPLTVGMSKLKDNWLLKNYSSSFVSKHWHIPDFFLIRNDNDVKKLTEICEASPKEIFFWKVDGKHSGSGVFPMTGREVIDNMERWNRKNRTSFVQMAVDDLALIEGSKFDIRTYILIASWDPFLIYFYKNHYLRRSLTKFSKNNTEKAVHLTNLAVFKQKYLEDDAVWHFSRFQEYAEAGNFPFDFSTVERNLKEALVDISTALHGEMSQLETSKWWFANFACDFMVDNSGEVHFIEFVWLPAMSLKTPMLKKLKMEYGEEIVNIQFEVATKRKNGEPICPQKLDTVCDFELINSWNLPPECSEV